MRCENNVIERAYNANNVEKLTVPRPNAGSPPQQVQDDKQDNFKKKIPQEV